MPSPWSVKHHSGDGSSPTITGTPAVGQTLHATAPAGSSFQWLRSGSPIAGATSADYTIATLDQGHTISARVTTTPAGLDIPGTALEVGFFGDSFFKGLTDGLSSQAKRIPTQVCAQLGAVESNFAVGGARQFLNDIDGTHPEILTQVYRHDGLHIPPAAAPYGPVWQVAVIQSSINNLSLTPPNTDRSIVTDALLRAIRRLRAAGAYEAFAGTGYTLSGAGSWTAVADTAASSGGGHQRALSDNATWQLAVPADFPGGTLRPYGPYLQGFGGIETFTKDGAAAGSRDNTGAIYQNGSQAWQHEIALTAGAHTIHSTVHPINTVENFNGCDFETATVPLVVIVGTTRAPSYPGGEHVITNADVVAQNTAVQTMLTAQFPSDPDVLYFDMDAVLAPGGVPDSSLFGPDAIHPNDAGATAVANALAAAIAGALP